MDRREPSAHAQATHRYSPASGRRPDRPTRLDLQRRLKLRQLTCRLPDAPVLALLACLGPTAALWPHASTGTFPGTPAGLGLSPGLFAPGSAPAAVGCARRRRRLRWVRRPRTWYTRLWTFPAYAPLAVEWPCGSAYAEGYGEEG
jgi:hypothetical protein